MSGTRGEVVGACGGEGTTACVAGQGGGGWSATETERVGWTGAGTRRMGARFRYYHRADEWPPISTAMGDKDSKETLKHGKPSVPEDRADIRKGFLYERVPHVTLKSIANNEEIDAIYERWQATLEPQREKINKAAKKRWEDWELPRLPADDLVETERVSAWTTLAKQNVADGS